MSTPVLDEVLGRLSDLMGASSDAAIAKGLGMKPQSLSNRKRRGSIPYDEICAYAADKNLSLDYILLGRGTAGSTHQDIDPSLLHEIGMELAVWTREFHVEIPNYNMLCYYAGLIYNKVQLERSGSDSYHPWVRQEVQYWVKLQLLPEEKQRVHPEERKHWIKSGISFDEVFAEQDSQNDSATTDLDK